MNLLADQIAKTKHTPACWEFPDVFSNPALYYDRADEALATLTDEQHAEQAQRRQAAEEAAVDVCMGCPLMFACEEAALECEAAEKQPIAGVAGGRTEAERREIIKARTGQTVPSPAQSTSPQVAPGDRGPRNQINDEQVRIMTAQGRNAAYIARELGCNERTVVRARKRLKEQADAEVEQATAVTAPVDPTPAPAVTAPVDLASAERHLMVQEMDREITAATRPAPTRTRRVTPCPDASQGRAVNIAQVTEPMRIIYDILADGDWHPRAELVGAATAAVSERDALAWWQRKHSILVDGVKVLNPRKVDTPLTERVQAGARDKVYNMLSASQRKGKTTERGGTDNDHYRFTPAARASWQQSLAARTGGAA